MMLATEHSKGLLAIDEELFKAHAALQAGQVEIYKCRLQSAFLSLQLLMKQDVKV